MSSFFSNSILYEYPREHRIVYVVLNVLGALTTAIIALSLPASWWNWGWVGLFLGAALAGLWLDTRRLASVLAYGVTLLLLGWMYGYKIPLEEVLFITTTLVLFAAVLLRLRDALIILVEFAIFMALTYQHNTQPLGLEGLRVIKAGAIFWFLVALFTILIAHFIRQHVLQHTLTTLEKQLGDLRTLNETILQNISDGVSIQDADGRFIFFSETGAVLLGYSPEELIGQPGMLLIPPEEQEKIIQADERRKQGITDSYEIRLKHKDGHLIDAIITGSPYFQGDTFAGFLAVFTNISALKNAQRAQEYIRQRLSILHQIDRKILDARSSTEIASAVLPHLKELLPVDRASVIQYDFERQAARILGGWEYTEPLPLPQSIPLSDFAVDTQFKEGKVRIIENLAALSSEQLSPIESAFLARGYRSLINIPLRAHEKELVGVLNIAHRQPKVYTPEHIQVAEEVATSLGVAIRQSLLLEAERRQRQLAETLRQATAALSESLDVEEVLQRILEYAQRVIPYKSANILSCQEEGFLPIAYQGEQVYPINTIIPHHTYPYLKQVLETAQPHISMDVRTDPTWKSTIHLVHVRSWMGIPLIVRQKVIGILNLHHDYPGVYTQKDIPLAETFGHQAAIAIHNARLFANEQQRNTEMALLQQASLQMTSNLDLKTALNGILSYALRLTKAYDAHIFLYENERLSFAAAMWANQYHEKPYKEPRQDGVTYRAARQGEKVVIPSFRESPLLQGTDWEGAIISLPLKIGQRVVGVMNVAYQQPHDFQPHEIQVLELLAAQAAVALENARLYTNLQTQFKRLNVLRTIDQAITGSVDLNLTLGILLEEITTHDEVNAAAVWLLSDPYTLRIAARRGLETQRLRAHTLRVGEGVIGKCALERQAVFYPDLRKEKNLPDYLGHLPYRTYCAVPLIAKGKLVGILEAYRLTPPSEIQEWRTFLDAIAGQTAIAINNAQLFTHLQQSNMKLTLAYEDTLEGWAHALELRDRETEGHTRRVTQLTLKLARRMGVPEDQMIYIRRGALLHDIGKMGIPDEILLKPGPLSPHERAIMQTHPELAYRLLSQISFLVPALDIPYCHHEKWDGSGYPRGLKGEEIPLAARIFAVVDVWDALTSDRPYRKAWTPEDTRNYLLDESERHFDPQVVRVFLEMLHQEGII